MDGPRRFPQRLIGHGPIRAHQSITCNSLSSSAREKGCCIFKDLSANVKSPLVGKVVNKISRDPVPTGVGRSRPTSICLIPVIAFKHEFQLIRDLHVKNPTDLHALRIFLSPCTLRSPKTEHRNPDVIHGRKRKQGFNRFAAVVIGLQSGK